MNQNGHRRIIAAAAKQHLLPLGCTRRGKSRFWFSDELFWLIGIAFEPSTYQRGTYLLVGVQWLWHVKPYFSSDAMLELPGRSQKPWVGFETEAQFLPEVESLIARATHDVQVFRQRFHSLPAIAQSLEKEVNGRTNSWHVFHAAIACALAQECSRSKQLFDRVVAEPVVHDWQALRNTEALHLASRIYSRDGFARAIRDRITQRRALWQLETNEERLLAALCDRSQG